MKDVFPSGFDFPVKNSPHGIYRKVDGVRYGHGADGEVDPLLCPVCGGIGQRWLGWFSCDGNPDCNAIAWIETGEVMRPAKQGDKP